MATTNTFLVIKVKGAKQVFEMQKKIIALKKQLSKAGFSPFVLHGNKNYLLIDILEPKLVTSDSIEVTLVLDEPQSAIDLLSPKNGSVVKLFI
jgi:Ethanolamine utilization protein EutJ (predicted chaperonin)